MIKMIVSSFYNTIINEDDAITRTTMLEIERLRNKGILFSICTNRTYQEVLDYNKDFPFLDYIIALNGSYIYDVKKARCILKKKISLASRKKITNIFSDKEIYYYTANNILTNKDNIAEEDIYKIEVVIDDINEINKLDTINVNYSLLERDNKKYLEIISNKSSMFTAVDQISLKNSIALKDILVVCANESDYSLVKNVPNSFVVKNANKELKKAAAHIINAESSQGVERLLKKIK